MVVLKNKLHSDVFPHSCQESFLHVTYSCTAQHCTWIEGRVKRGEKVAGHKSSGSKNLKDMAEGKTRRGWFYSLLHKAGRVQQFSLLALQWHASQHLKLHTNAGAENECLMHVLPLSLNCIVARWPPFTSFHLLSAGFPQLVVLQHQRRWTSPCTHLHTRQGSVLILMTSPLCPGGSV